MKKIIGLLIAAIVLIGVAFGINQNKENVVANKAVVESGNTNKTNSSDKSSTKDQVKEQPQDKKDDSKDSSKENKEEKQNTEKPKDSKEGNKVEKTSPQSEKKSDSTTNNDKNTSKTTVDNSSKINTNTSNNSNSNVKVDEAKKEEAPKKENKETVTISIKANKAIDYGIRKEDGFSHLPSNGVILGTTKVDIKDGENVFDVLTKVVRQHNIQMEYTGAGSAIYIQGIDNLYEFDCGKYSGWMYEVNGVYPNYGVGAYKLKDGDKIVFNYTCDLGKDLGA
ncbi:DUF4430 domain-containing protein [Clostridium sp.]|uniref:DUF4430 domain-containing protein n=1 Tax=Clostridium sp. TaxID=1506 RepID=UPI002602C4FE|nr:DUF4430 domain-containing protein [Clostridium sp.]